MSLVLGAYPVEPSDPGDQRAFYSTIEHAGWYSALEMPFYAAGGRPYPQSAPASWSVVLTAIPGTMRRMADDPFFGLASTDPDGRRRAIEFSATIRDHVARLAGDGHRTIAVELHSAPRGRGSARALADSLRHMAAWDWCGARLTIEHCDALREGQAPEKGFLPLDDEIHAIASARAQTGADFGVTINWARSVIETRDIEGARRHIRDARAAGVLSGLMFSSCSPIATDFGYPWIDAHLPPREVVGAPSSSLLTSALIHDCVAAAGPHLYTGVKIGLEPQTLPPAEKASRLNSVAAALRLPPQETSPAAAMLTA